MDPLEPFMNVMTLHSTALTALALYLTILSGYLVAAYAVGADLNKFQVFFINTIFILFSSSLALYFFGLFRGSFQGGPAGGAPEFMFYILYAFFICQFLAIAGAIKFMQDIRSKKNSD